MNRLAVSTSGLLSQRWSPPCSADPSSRDAGAPQEQGIDSDQSFASRVDQAGRYRLAGKTDDAGHAYEFDQPVFPDDGGATLRTSLAVGWTKVRGGDIGGTWIPVQVTWNEVTGQNTGSVSVVVVLYADDTGKVWRVA